MTAKSKIDRDTPIEDFIPRDGNDRKLRTGTETRSGVSDETTGATTATPIVPIESGEQDLPPVPDETGVRTAPITRTSPDKSTGITRATTAAPIQPDDLDTATSPSRSGETMEATTDARTAPGTPRRSTTSIVEDEAGVTGEDAVPNGNSKATGHTVPYEMSVRTAPITRTSPSEPSEVPSTTANTAESTDTRTGTDTDPTRRTVKQRKSELDEYRRRYMQTPKIEDRKPVFVSRRTRDRFDRIVRLLGERGMSVSGLIENIAIHHLDTHEPDVEYWRKL